MATGVLVGSIFWCFLPPFEQKNRCQDKETSFLLCSEIVFFDVVFRRAMKDPGVTARCSDRPHAMASVLKKLQAVAMRLSSVTLGLKMCTERKEVPE